MKGWLTAKDMAAYCMVSRATVRRWIKTGKLLAIRLPSGHYRVGMAEFRSFLENWDIPLKRELFGPESEGKEVKANGSTDVNGNFRAGRGSRPNPG